MPQRVASTSALLAALLGSALAIGAGRDPTVAVVALGLSLPGHTAWRVRSHLPSWCVLSHSTTASGALAVLSLATPSTSGLLVVLPTVARLTGDRATAALWTLFTLGLTALLAPSLAPALLSVLATVGLLVLVDHLHARMVHAEATLRDLTAAHDQTQAQLKQALATRTRLLESVSHELRTPLHQLRSVEDELRLHPEIPETIRQRQQDQIDHLLQLVDALLLDARGHQGALPNHPVRLPVGRMVEETVAAFLEPARKRGLDLLLDLDPRLPWSVDLDPSHLHGALHPVLQHTLAITRSGGLTVTLDRDPHALVLDLSDTNGGLPPEGAHRLFEPFLDAERPMTDDRAGLRLGLTNAATHAQAMGGSWEVMVRPGRGAVYRLRIPLVAPSDDTLADRRRPALPTTLRAHIATPSIPAARRLLRWLDAWGLEEVAAQEASLVLGHDAPAGLAAVALSEPGRPRDVDVRLDTLVAAMERAMGHLSGRAVPPQRGHVLIVDDQPVNLAIARRMVERLGLEAKTVASGAEALSSLREERPLLVLMDIRMPGMDGIETTHRLRALGTAYQDLPVIALTAETAPESVAHMLAAGMEAHLPKPVSLDQLSSTLERFVPVAASAA